MKMKRDGAAKRRARGEEAGEVGLQASDGKISLMDEHFKELRITRRKQG